MTIYALFLGQYINIRISKDIRIIKGIVIVSGLGGVSAVIYFFPYKSLSLSIKKKLEGYFFPH